MIQNGGGYSQIETELELLKAAAPRNYDYYHLLSGMDLPLKNQNQIHKFFEIHKGNEFIHFGSNDDAISRCRYYWIGQELLGSPANTNLLKRNLYKIRKVSIYIQKLIGVNRVKRNGFYTNVGVGSNWFSITNSLAQYVVSKEDELQKSYRNTYCCDEIFLQTLVKNSDFADRLYMDSVNDYHANMRKIDWKRGNPYIWKDSDFKELISSDYLFARKFDESVDEKIINRIYEYLRS